MKYITVVLRCLSPRIVDGQKMAEGVLMLKKRGSKKRKIIFIRILKNQWCKVGGCGRVGLLRGGHVHVYG